ncbi:50S ribosomal protein L4 [Candidatus Daviesbacteria bacterium]|nr:50S ribosomal protein L4 [Candidatus Daviesbacteria bacterium]
MPVKKTTTKKSTANRLPSTAKKAVVSSQKPVSLSIPVYSMVGAESGSLTLPKEIFAVKVNKQLLAQAMRIYMTNQKNLNAFTKTRGEVEEKGTGRARHGAVRAPIFVGGGIIFGPKPRKVRLELPQAMKKAALFSALASKLADKNVVGVTGIEKALGKTKEVVQLLSKIIGKDQKIKSALIMIEGKSDNVVRAAKNIQGVDVIQTNLLNAYEVLRHEMLILTKEAVEKLTKPNQEEKK